MATHTDIERTALLDLLVKHSTREGLYTLASGQQSTLYIDARRTTMRPEGLSLVGSLGLQALTALGWRVDSVGGLTLGADPIALAISFASTTTSAPIRAFTVRKEAKTHGMGGIVEGAFEPGDHIVIVEDVITTGTSISKALAAVQTKAGNIVGILALIDRNEGGRLTLEKQGYKVHSLINVTEITDRLHILRDKCDVLR